MDLSARLCLHKLCSDSEEPLQPDGSIRTMLPGFWHESQIQPNAISRYPLLNWINISCSLLLAKLAITHNLTVYKGNLVEHEWRFGKAEERTSA